VVAVVPVVAVVIAAPIERLKKIVAVIEVAAIGVVAIVIVAAAPARLHHVGLEAETYWPRVRPRQPRCCKISRYGRVWRVPAAGYCAGQCREPMRILLFVGHLLQLRPGWEAATHRLY